MAREVNEVGAQRIYGLVVADAANHDITPTTLAGWTKITGFRIKGMGLATSFILMNVHLGGPTTGVPGQGFSSYLIRANSDYEERLQPRHLASVAEQATAVAVRINSVGNTAYLWLFGE